MQLKTYATRKQDVKREWHIINAEGQTLGRLASQAAKLIIGKHKPMWAPNQDCGDFVVVYNAAKVRVTGNKMKEKIYYHHSQYPHGFKHIAMDAMMETFPTRAVEFAINGMLPHTRLGDMMRKRLRVYAGAEYPQPPGAKKAAKPAKEAVKEAKEGS